MAARRPVPSRYASLKADGASGILNPPLPPTPTNQIRSELAYVSSPIPSPAPRRELGRHEAPPNAITSTIMGPNFAGRGVYQEKLLPNPGYAPSIRSIETTVRFSLRPLRFSLTVITLSSLPRTRFHIQEIHLIV